jgi:hypothetical protein
MTQETNPALVKWKNWLNTNSVGIYQYTCSTGNCADWYKPHQNCLMEKLDKSFCSVCKEGIIEKIHSLISPIESYSPESNSINDQSLPSVFQLNLIKPDPNTLTSTWTLNAAVFANDVDEVSILETDLDIGSNTLTAVVHDDTTLLNVDNHDTIHLYSVTWTIDNSALGIETVKSEVNNLSVALFPNPSNTFVNFKIESVNDSNFKIDLLSIDGKKIRTISLSNFETQQVDISFLSSGLYLVNIYANNIFVASKKLVKN